MLESPWLWIAAGVVAAGAIAGGVWAASADGDPFRGNLPPGTIDVR